MKYIELFLVLSPDNPIHREVLIACLEEAGYESFLEEQDLLHAYIPQSRFDEQSLMDSQGKLSPSFSFSYTMQTLAEKNWNQAWEESYKPVRINNHCAVRAPFHNPVADVEHEIIIEPQMSFGTAHHETTSMALDMMTSMDFSQKDVLDMGSGTGVLAIYACIRGAKTSTAVDNELWAYKNTMENAKRNHKIINTIHGSLKDVKSNRYDVILANINRNILLSHIPEYCRMMPPWGQLLVSGFYREDLSTIRGKAEDHGLKLKQHESKRNWIAALFAY